MVKQRLGQEITETINFILQNLTALKSCLKDR